MNYLVQSTKNEVARYEAVPFSTLYQDHLEDFFKSNGYSESTKKTYRKHIRNFLAWCQVRDISTPVKLDLEKYKGEIVDRYSPSTQHGAIAAIKSFYSWLEYAEIIPFNPFHNFKNVRVRSYDMKEHEIFSREQAKEIIKCDTTTIKGKRDTAIFATMFCLGLRTIEIERLNVGDLKVIDNKAVLYIYGKGRKSAAEFEIIPAQLERVLKDYLDTRENPKPEEPLFQSYCHRCHGVTRIRAGSVSRIVKTKLRELGIDDSQHTAHSIRATALSILLDQNNGNIQAGQMFMRHESPNTTMRYAHNFEKMKSTSTAQIANIIF